MSFIYLFCKIEVELLISHVSGLGTFQLHCCLCRDRKLSDFIKNIFICVPKMNEGLTGLERHEGE